MERMRERERHTDRQIDSQTDRHRDREQSIMRNTVKEAETDQCERGEELRKMGKK